ncbi:PREDICTED: unconventional myosin-VIIa-like [Amphimedon queenslandica]|uniref:Myosin VIIa n=1 Tax=Amphimedon queenslandica TaxID=400682 RepID=A0A1X7VLP1_AMPQE|nr:PREDICTED: unconventional myosin-VIIa-like [Amphimedon queenslandica]|eukprot:XP_019863708.1 PREDICTED: unconventional myosin-VIIa-like [Amphimedon queenslandica]
MLLQKGDKVWLDITQGGEFEVPIGAVVEFSDSGQIKLIDDDGGEHWIDPRKDKNRIRPMHQTSAEGVEDMIQLGDLTESGIMHNVQMRYHNKMIYTFTGSILVALNPYKVLPIYDQEHIHKYTNKRIGEEPPHIFAIADNAYHFMCREEHDQCVVITGESGAGKTESTKLILQFLAHVSGQHTWIEQQILDTNPILETFGNAKTQRNDNSSRFGKYIDVHFDVSGHIQGAMIQQYLLEKSRIVNQLNGERNYHIFYRILAGLSKDDLSKLGLVKDPWQYSYLTKGDTVTVDDPNMQDLEEFKHATGAMKVCQFTQDDQWNVWTIVASVMQLGNIEFEETEKRNMPVAYIDAKEALNLSAKSLQVSAEALENALCTRRTITHGESIISPLSSAVACNVRDAFVKGIYGRLFIWIVKKLNEAIYKPPEGKAKKHISIGVLDIFGFEAFGKNSFEQMCINYCNENLQQFFVRHIFKLEQVEYDKEKINWSRIEFKDNQEILDLLGQKPLNIISLIDEESRFPKGTDDSMLDKLHKQHSKHPHYIKPKSQARRAFGIQHFAGAVFYDADEFLEKNRDTFSADLFDLLQSSKSKFLGGLFSGEKAMTSETRKKAPTLGLQFKQSLDALMKTLEACQPFFVRCIKPNETKSPLLIERELCVRQLRYSGMMETIRIRRAGYPIRHLFHHFIERYQYLVPQLLNNYPERKAACKVICKRVLGESSDYQIGITKIFLKDQDDQLLEETREIQLTKRVVIIQKTFRGYVVRKQYKMLKRAVLIVQKNWKRLQTSRDYRKMRRGFIRLQACFRSRKVRRWYLTTYSRIRRFQCRCRGYLARERAREKQRAIIKIQSVFRVILAKKILKRKRIEKKRRDEAERIKREEEERLKREMAAEEARKQAEKLHQERLAKMEKEDREEEERKKQEGLKKAEDAKRKADDARRREEEGEEEQEPIEDSEVVQQMFNFLDSDSKHISETGKIDIPLPEDDEDLSEYKFPKFAATYFQGNATPSWVKRKKLKHPLLALKHEIDTLLALDIWVMMLRFMGDLPEPVVEEDIPKEAAPTGLRKKVSTLGRKFLMNNNKLIAQTGGLEGEEGYQPGEDDEQAMSRGEEKRKESLRRRLVSMTLKKVTKVPQEVMNMSQESESAVLESSKALLRPTTNLEKLHFIIGFGILRPELRDEIYCQICKQLTQNPNKSSHARGWVLLSLCVGCFAPSKRLIKYLRCFITEGPPGYAPYCEERLRRTLMNGPRQQPPSWLELQATKSKKPLMLPITFMDGSTKALLADSATTAKELCTLLAKRIGLKDPFGFSLYIALFDKVSSLGSEGDHIMDAISQCEQYAKDMGAQERSAPWRLFFRKEIFSPWHNPSEDQVGTNLIYQQIIRGIKFGEYLCDKNEDLASLAAQQYYIEYGGDITSERVGTLLAQYIPDSCLAGMGMKERWIGVIVKAFKEAPYVQNRIDRNRVKEGLIMFAKYRWPLLFSKFFEAYRFSGPTLPQNDVIIAVNWTGVYFVDDQEHVLLETSFPEITNVTSSRTASGQSFTIVTVKGEEYTFTSANGEEICQLVNYFLEGLRKRSSYVIPTMDYQSPGEGSEFLSFRKGDLIILEDDTYGENVMQSGWCSGTCERTGQKGHFPAECVYILPTITKPVPEVLALFVGQSQKDMERIIATTQSALEDDEQDTGVPYTLEKYSYEYFRVPKSKTLSGSIRGTLRKKSAETEIWAHVKEPIKKALLKRFDKQPEELHQKACASFLAILKYMGDYPSKKQRLSTELTDQVFEHVLSQEVLRDEVYCQLIKQLTFNKLRASEERGWELLWLASGLFPCSQILHKEINQFLRSRIKRWPIAADIQQRLYKSAHSGARRYPPHLVEVDAIQNKTTQIFHKVFFPDDSSQAFEVDSSTRSRDFCATIAERLGLKFKEGFSLFVKIGDKVISVPEADFFFDFVRHLTEWLKRARGKDGANSNPSYKVFFMKKLWVNITIGKDRKSDVIFHYHQELPKYLRGYHKCTRDDAALLGSYIYRVKFGDTRSHFGEIPQILRELIPHDMLREFHPEDWKRAIVANFSRHHAKSSEEAKISFLKYVSRWDTFGSAFFEVRQTTEPRLPEILLIGLNKNGVMLIDPANKDILAIHPFTMISNWSCGSNYFHMTIGNLIKGSRLLCETSLGYKMDDLLTSYISLVLANINKKNPEAVGGAGSKR